MTLIASLIVHDDEMDDALEDFPIDPMTRLRELAAASPEVIEFVRLLTHVWVSATPPQRADWYDVGLLTALQVPEVKN